MEAIASRLEASLLGWRPLLFVIEQDVLSKGHLLVGREDHRNFSRERWQVTGVTYVEVRHQWIGPRENLEETLVFPLKTMDVLSIVP